MTKRKSGQEAGTERNAPARVGHEGRGRRRKRSRGDLREQAIVEATRRLLSERSWSEINVSDIARAAGISRSSFYFYFDSRESVLLEIAGEVEQGFFEADSAFLRRSDESPSVALRRVIQANLRIWHNNGAILRAVLDARDGDPALASFRRDMAEHFVSAIAGQIERERAAGTTAEGTPGARQLARVLLIMTERVYYELTRDPPSKEAEARICDALEAIWFRAIYGGAGGDGREPNRRRPARVLAKS